MARKTDFPWIPEQKGGEIPNPLLVRIRRALVDAVNNASSSEAPEVVVQPPFSTLPLSPEEEIRLLGYMPDQPNSVYALRNRLRDAPLTPETSPRLTKPQSELLRIAFKNLEQ